MVRYRPHRRPPNRSQRIAAHQWEAATCRDEAGPKPAHYHVAPGVPQCFARAPAAPGRRARMGGRSLEGNRICVHATVGTPIDGPACTHRFQRALAEAGLPKLRFHDLRHTCATLLLARGVHPRLVMEILGHSQIAVTKSPRRRTRIFSPVAIDL